MFDKLTERSLKITFYLLFLLTPFAIYPYTSEIFEFNKIVLTYIATILIVLFWLLRMIINKKFILKRTLLDIPLIIFLAVYALAALISIDPRTSFFGYYSRFHGGLLSMVSYSFLYWAYVSNMDKASTIKAIKMLFLVSFLVSVWAILEHFGRSLSCLIFPEFRTFDVSCWVQDVQNRVYATLGQPNWLAAWIVAILPLTWSHILSFKIKSKKFFLYLLLSLVLFMTLLFTKSRSGILAFAVSAVIFWGLIIINNVRDGKRTRYLKPFVICNLMFILIALVAGTPWTQKLTDLISDQKASNIDISTQHLPGPALETGELIPQGGTESGEIRKIVWKGAIDIWKNYPVFGTGPETFAYSYYNFRPVGHNLVSEWDYLYNKAHNEYLNYLATTGTVGTLSYLILIGTTIILFTKIANNLHNMRKGKARKSSHSVLDLREDQFSNSDQSYLLVISLLSGYTSILVTNFFGFSVVLIGILSFLYPGMAVALTSKEEKSADVKEIKATQKILAIFALILSLYLLSEVISYWQTDKLYAKGRLYNDAADYATSATILQKTLERSPKEAIFHEEYAQSLTNLAVLYDQNQVQEDVKNLAALAIAESNTAISLSPANVNLKRSYASNLISLSAIDPNFMFLAKDVLQKAIIQAPTDAKLHYNLALVDLRTGNLEEARDKLITTIEMKENYLLARHALAIIYTDLEETEKAREQYEYILKYLSPGNETIERELNELNSSD